MLRTIRCRCCFDVANCERGKESTNTELVGVGFAFCNGEPHVTTTLRLLRASFCLPRCPVASFEPGVHCATWFALITLWDCLSSFGKWVGSWAILANCQKSQSKNPKFSTLVVERAAHKMKRDTGSDGMGVSLTFFNRRHPGGRGIVEPGEVLAEKVLVCLVIFHKLGV